MNLLRALLSVTVLLILAGCGGTAAEPEQDAGFQAAGRMELRYAEQFTVEYDGAGRALITIDGTDRYCAVPEGVPVPEGLPEGTAVLRTPLKQLYVASSSSMDHFRRLNALDAVRFTSTKEGDWALPEVRASMEAGELIYAGKYSAPDFEALLEEGVPLAVENTMIYHAPDIKEQLESIGIPVLVDKCGYEPHPLGRMEWVKLYGLLLGRAEDAAAFFDAQTAEAEAFLAGTDTGITAAFFRVTPNGYVNVRRPGDYVTRLIALAGGHYVLDGVLEDNGTQSTVNMQIEAFYQAARDADVLIYDSAMEPGLDTLSGLLEKNELLADFRAVQAGNVWCTEQNMFQETCGTAGMLRDLTAVLSGAADGADRLTYLHRLK